MMQGVLYISYDGMLEPLGQSQVLAYFKRLAADRRIHLISFEKSDDWANTPERQRIAQDIAAAGIVWHPLRYHKRPTAVATAWDIACGITLGLWLVLRYRLALVHARSYVPAVMALALKRLTGVKFLFDIRGFWADAMVVSGLYSFRMREVALKVRAQLCVINRRNRPLGSTWVYCFTTRPVLAQCGCIYA
jgi:hypothetical protein